MTSGNIQPRLSWYFSDAITRSLVAYSPTAITTVTGWTAYSFSGIVPPGITNCLVEVRATDLNGPPTSMTSCSSSSDKVQAVSLPEDLTAAAPLHDGDG